MSRPRTMRALAGAVVALILVFGCAALMGARGGGGAAAAGDCTADPSLDSEETAFLMLVNNHRAQNGLAPLQASRTLSQAAQWKSQDMGTRAYFAHDDGWRTWVQRLRDCGYGENAWLGENIAAGISSAQAAFDLWKNSPGHNANMLGANYTAIGIGRAWVAGSPYGWYWTTEFASINDGWPAATPTPLPATPTHTAPPATATRTATATVTRTPTVTPTRTPTVVPTHTATVAAPTNTPPPPTPTRTPTATATLAPSSVHVGDLDGAVTGKGRWTARVTVWVHTSGETPVAGAIVSGRWNGVTNASCTTDSSGRCTVQLGKISAGTPSASFAVTGVSAPGAAYDAAANHDVDGGSDGSVITVAR